MPTAPSPFRGGFTDVGSGLSGGPVEDPNNDPLAIDPAVLANYVKGPASAINGDFAQFNGATGKLIEDGGLSIDLDGTMAADSDSRLPSQRAVVTYVALAGGAYISSTLANGHIIVGNASNVAAAVAMSGDATISNTGALALAATAVSAGSYGDSTHIPAFTVDAKGRLTAASSNAISVPSAANPTATASDTAVNGSAATFMRSDAAPAVQKCSSSVFGLAKVDGTTITATGGVISAAGATGANPSATASDTAVNGSAATFMRSDGAPAIQKASASQFGVAKADGTTITSSGGVLSASLGGLVALAFAPGFVTGRYYTTPNGGTTGSTLSGSTGTMWAVPFFVPNTTTFTKAATSFNINTNVTKLTFAVYAATGGVPAALLFSTELTGISLTGTKEVTGLSWTLAPGWYFLAMSMNGSASCPANQANGLTSYLLGEANPGTFCSGYSVAWVYASGSPPSPFGSASQVAGNCPQLFVAP